MCAGLGRLTIGCGAMAVMPAPPGATGPSVLPAMLRDICVPRLPSTAPSRSAVSCDHSTAASGTLIVAHRGAAGKLGRADLLAFRADLLAGGGGCREPGGDVDGHAVGGVGIGHEPGRHRAAGRPAASPGSAGRSPAVTRVGLPAAPRNVRSRSAPSAYRRTSRQRARRCRAGGTASQTTALSAPAAAAKSAAAERTARRRPARGRPGRRALPARPWRRRRARRRTGAPAGRGTGGSERRPGARIVSMPASLRARATRGRPRHAAGDGWVD